MALKLVIPFPITTINPTTTTTTTASNPTEVRFSRWNNSNADKFERHRRTQQQIEDDLRRLRRFQSALNISNTFQNSPPPQQRPPPSFKSTGTPSIPSLSSIPAKKSKYSKPRKNSNHNATSSHPTSHPAFHSVSKPKRNLESSLGGEIDIRVGENGLKYVVPGAPFEFMYSYTETPKNVKPVGLREPAVTPFGPGTMARPWTGRKPLPGSKKKLPEFDSFNVPEGGKKGVKPVQKPGPYLPGTGPKYVMSREEVLGEPLTVEEVKDLVQGCRNTKRQLNMGRDGLTHNMLDNIHAHWKRRRVCKIKCLGVCTVDMDNVCQQLEEKTGGKIIYRRGGVVYLFRGRNYNYKTRPRFPLMLWKPVAPVYPRLVKRVPEGLTLDEATDMRKRGRELIPICKLGKNGVYANLAKNVREAFEECELVRINCQGLNPSDYRKIGAKLKDLVPCVLISFENEHILMWRGKDWKPSVLLPEDSSKGDKSCETNGALSHGSIADDSLYSKEDDDDEELLSSSNILNEETSDEPPNVKSDVTEDIVVVSATKAENRSFVKDTCMLHSSGEDTDSAAGLLVNEPRVSDDMSPLSVAEAYTDVSDNLEVSLASSPSDLTAGGDLQNIPETSSLCTKGVVDLLRQAVDSGRAVILTDPSFSDADMVYERSVALAQVAPPGPVYRHRPRKAVIKKFENKKIVDSEADEAEENAEVKLEAVSVTSPVRKFKEPKNSRVLERKDIKQEYIDVVPQGSLKIDELAKLLA